MPTCCWPARPAVSASRKRWRSAPRNVRVLEPEPVLRSALRHGLGPSPPGRRIRVYVCRARGRSPRCATAAITTSSTCPPISSTPPRPTRRPSASEAIAAYVACPGTRRHRVDSGVDPRLPGLCAAHAGHGRARRCWLPASPTRPRIPWSTVPPGAPASCCPTSRGARRASPQCGNSVTIVRSMCRGIRASTPSPRARTSTTTCRRFHSPMARSPRRAPTIPSPTKPRRCSPRADAIARRIQPRADHARSPVLLRGAAAGPARHDPEAARDPAAGRDRCAGQPGGAGAGDRDRAAGAAGAACRARADCAATRRGLVRPLVYFPALGLGFLFIEIYLIEKASLWLNDRTSGFALVLTGMLVFSGLGSMAADRLVATPHRSLALACLVIVGWCLVVLVGSAAGDPCHARPALVRACRLAARGPGTGLACARACRSRSGCRVWGPARCCPGRGG